MHFITLRSLTQPCMAAYCLYCKTYDPGISAGSANQCILGDMYLRSNPSRKLIGVRHDHICSVSSNNCSRKVEVSRDRLMVVTNGRLQCCINVD